MARKKASDFSNNCELLAEYLVTSGTLKRGGPVAVKAVKDAKAPSFVKPGSKPDDKDQSFCPFLYQISYGIQLLDNQVGASFYHLQIPQRRLSNLPFPCKLSPTTMYHHSARQFSLFLELTWVPEYLIYSYVSNIWTLLSQLFVGRYSESPDRWLCEP